MNEPNAITITTTGAVYDADHHTITLQMSQADFLALLQFGVRVGGQAVTFTDPAQHGATFAIGDRVQYRDGTNGVVVGFSNDGWIEVSHDAYSTYWNPDHTTKSPVEKAEPDRHDTFERRVDANGRGMGWFPKDVPKFECLRCGKLVTHKSELSARELCNGCEMELADGAS